MVTSELPPATYAERLKWAMAQAQLTPADLRKHLEVSYAAMRKVMIGDTKSLSADNHMKACTLIGCDPNWLATGLGRPFLGDVPVPGVSAEPWPVFRFIDERSWRLLSDADRAALEISMLHVARDLGIDLQAAPARHRAQLEREPRVNPRAQRPPVQRMRAASEVDAPPATRHEIIGTDAISATGREELRATFESAARQAS